MKFDQRGTLWAGTDQRGVFQFRDSREVNHFTFDNTAGGLRSNRIHTIFIDREGVIWFGTDRGVCRYDPSSFRVENISDERGSNFARTLFESRNGRIFCGTNRGLFIRSDSGWIGIDDLKGRTIHTIAEDGSGRLALHSEGEGGFLLELEDDGHGFDAQAKSASNGRGLANIRSRAGLIEAEAQWTARQEGGTRFILRRLKEE